MATLSIGNVSRVTKLEAGLDLLCERGRVRITALSPGIIRVRATQAADFGADFSYAVAKRTWKKHPVRMTGDTLTTKQLTVRVSRQPFALEFVAPDGTVLNRELAIEWDGAKCRSRRDLAAEEMFFGCGEKTGAFNKRGQSLGFWNTDNPAHTYLNSEVYVSIPFLISSRGYGIFWDNTHRSQFNFGNGDETQCVLEADAGEIDYYFFAGNPREIVRVYTELTGRMELPPRWALGYQQCRWSYLSADEVLEVARVTIEIASQAEGAT